jgi:ABC-type proline/glycine betaine transport system ATPase subunit
LQETLDAYTRGIELGSTTGELAALLGKTEASVKKELAWLSLPKDVIKAVDTGSFPRAGLAEIVKFPANKVEKAFAKAAKGTNVKEISGILKNYSKDLSESKKKKAELKKETPTAAEKRETKAANTKKRQAWTTAHAKITGFENLPTAFGKADIGKFADELKASAKILQDMIVEMEARKAELK